MKGILSVLVAVTALLNAADGLACKVIRTMTPEGLVANAELIVRATAVEYDGPRPRTGTTGVADSKVRFRIESVLKGSHASNTLALNGYLSANDDWNDQSSPYSFVRPGGRAGSCFANTYRTDGQFVLMLKRVSNPAFEGDTEYTVNWAALAPVNEQVRSADDPWAKWVASRIEAQRTNTFSVVLRGDANSEAITVTVPAGLTEIQKKMDEIGFWDDAKFPLMLAVPNEICDAGVRRERIELVATRGATLKRVTFLNPGCAKVGEFKPARDLIDLKALIKQWSQAEP